ncbi:hypothetical protein COCON_G00140080 [Conger conger]|uniref:Uncharacterized protein n=1 Tax=Conger conger TaxID=82655 RepID=A0A9Q1DB35_CONCO|nr:hypothetical protein COCON_G00140080 [Conger conger]
MEGATLGAAAMDSGVLETAVTLGLIKIACSLFYFPTLRDFNSVGFCCSCLLIFTDLLVTVFLALLWLARPWKPPSLAPSDVIVPRLLLFLDHTYGTMLLLTAPLLAVDTACRLRWPSEGGFGRGQGGHRAGDPECPRGHGSGACGGQDWRAEGLLVEACLETGGSLPTCLPDLPAVALRTLGSPSPVLASLALSLLLAVTMGVLRGGWGQGAWWLHGQPAVPVSVYAATPTPSGAPVHSRAEDGRIPPTPLTTPAAQRPRVQGESPREDVLLAIPTASAPNARPSPRLPVAPGDRPRLPVAPGDRPRPWGRGSVAIGLVCAAALCLLPPAMAVNAMLIRTAERLAERGLRRVLPAPR